MTTDTIPLQPGESALFGYGSLISIASLERTLGRRYTGPFVVCELAGWRRTWDVAMPNRRLYFADTPAGPLYPENILYLNVRRAPGSMLNGIVFVVDAPELAAFDQREWIYDRVDATAELRGINIQKGSAFVYTAKPEYLLAAPASAAQAAVRSTYLDILDAGFHDLGENFRKAFESSSDLLPRQLVIADRRAEHS